MNKPRLALWVVLILAICQGLSSVLGALLVEDTALQFRISALIGGGFLLAGAWLLFRGRYTSVFVFVVSASIYALAVLIPAFLKYGDSALSVLMGAFYISLLFRVALAIAAHFVVRQRHG
jgi:hypothetical protein